MHKRPVCCVCVFLMLFLCILDLAGVSIVRGNPLPQKVRQWIKAHPSAVICGEVQRCQDTEYSLSVYLKQVYLTDQSEKIPIRNIRVFLKENIKEDLKTGMIIQVKGELERISAPGNPGEFDQQQYYACQKIYYFMKNAVVQKKSRSYSRYGQALTELREKIAETLQKAAGDKAGIYQAMLLGEKSGLDEDVKMRYQMAGMIHILAISGVKTLKLDIPLVPETRINWAFMPLHIVIIYILKLCLDEEIIPRCRFPCSRGYFKKCINYQKKQLFSVSQSYCKSLINQQKEKKPMAYKKYREMKVYEASGYQYKRTPSIVLKGQWLSELGFDIGEQIEVKCEDGRLIITKANEIWT